MSYIDFKVHQLLYDWYDELEWKSFEGVIDTPRGSLPLIEGHKLRSKLQVYNRRHPDLEYSRKLQAKYGHDSRVKLHPGIQYALTPLEG